MASVGVPFPMARRLAAAAACALALPLSAQAMTALRAGLWQQHNETEINGKDAIAEMAETRKQMLQKLTPEQRAMIEQKFGPADADPHLAKVCVTPEQVARYDSPQDLISQLNGGDGCVYGDPRGSGDSIKFSGTCTGAGNFNGHMDGLLTIASAKAYTMSFSGTGAVAASSGAVPMRVSGKIDAKWVSDDCGDVKPIE